MFVKPAEHDDAPLRVRLCHAPHRLLPPEGGHVPETQDWYRAVVRGDVVLADPSAPASDEQAPASDQAATGVNAHE
jgi:hypothetical protein